MLVKFTESFNWKDMSRFPMPQIKNEAIDGSYENQENQVLFKKVECYSQKFLFFREKV